MGKSMQPKPASSSNLLALPDGTELVSDFRIKRVLGAGGFGITYLAEEIALARLVTIKEYFPADYAARSSDIEASPRSRECASDYKWGLDRFIEEAQTLARFVHPNIVRVYRYFRANNTGYMVLQFEEGGSFKSWLKGLKRAPRQAELDAILGPLLDALEMVHKGDFLHRDIAPDNIIIRQDKSPVLIDFGSARGEIASHSKTVSALVKPGYSPYEQYATTSSKQGPWTDIYALGATLYHAIAGKRPPDAPSRMVNDDYISAREAALSSYRPGFLAAIDKALNLEVTERPQSVAEWKTALLTPEAKREKGRLGLPGRKPRTIEVRPEPTPAATPATVALREDDPLSLVPAPPDAPQNQGQLLDFIEALKKNRPNLLTPRKKAASAEVKKRPAAKEPDPVEVRAPARPRFKFGYGPALDIPGHEPAPAKAAKAAPAEKPKPAPAPAKAKLPVPVASRAPPRPRRMRTWTIAPRQWRSLAFKLLVGIGIASLAVAYQDRVPHIQGRGAGLVSSQSADLTQAPRLTGHNGAVNTVALADQGRWIVSTGSDGTLKIWNTGSGALVRTIELDEGPATALAVEDRRALTGHKGGAVVLWDLDRAEKLAVVHHRAPISSLTLTGDPNRFFAASQDGAVALFDVRSPNTPAPLGDDVESGAQLMALAGPRGMLVTGGRDRNIRLWRTDSLSLARTWRTGAEGIVALDITPAARTIATAGADGKVRLWTTSSSRVQRTLDAHQGRVTALALAPNGGLLATAGEDGDVKLWNMRGGRNGARTLRGHTGAVRSVSFSSDGQRLVSAGQDGSIRIWNTVASPRD